MNYIQVNEMGRCGRELANYAIVSGRDPLEVLAAEIDEYWERGAVIVPFVTEPNSYAIWRKESLIGGKQVIRIRIVEVGMDAEDTAEIVIGANDIGTEEYSK